MTRHSIEFEQSSFSTHLLPSSSRPRHELTVASQESSRSAHCYPDLPAFDRLGHFCAKPNHLILLMRLLQSWSRISGGLRQVWSISGPQRRNASYQRFERRGGTNQQQQQQQQQHQQQQAFSKFRPVARAHTYGEGIQRSSLELVQVVLSSMLPILKEFR